MRGFLYGTLVVAIVVLLAALLTGCAIIYEKAGTNDENSSCVLFCFSSGSDMIGDQEMEPDDTSTERND